MKAGATQTENRSRWISLQAQGFCWPTKHPSPDYQTLEFRTGRPERFRQRHLDNLAVIEHDLHRAPVPREVAVAIFVWDPDAVPRAGMLVLGTTGPDTLMVLLCRDIPGPP